MSLERLEWASWTDFAFARSACLEVRFLTVFFSLDFQVGRASADHPTADTLNS